MTSRWRSLSGTISVGDLRCGFDGIDELERVLGEMGSRRTPLHLVERSARDRIEDLTRPDLEIAAAVCRGATNRQVAGAMFYSVKAVEARLTRIYRRLGISGRGELLDRAQPILEQAATEAIADR